MSTTQRTTWYAKGSGTGGKGAPGAAPDYDAFGLPSEGLDRFAQSEGVGFAYGQRADKHEKLAEGQAIA